MTPVANIVMALLTFIAVVAPILAAIMIAVSITLIAKIEEALRKNEASKERN